jgi:hypothetical protein
MLTQARQLPTLAVAILALAASAAPSLGQSSKRWVDPPSGAEAPAAPEPAPATKPTTRTEVADPSPEAARPKRQSPARIVRAKPAEPSARRPQSASAKVTKPDRKAVRKLAQRPPRAPAVAVAPPRKRQAAMHRPRKAPAQAKTIDPRRVEAFLRRSLGESSKRDVAKVRRAAAAGYRVLHIRTVEYPDGRRVQMVRPLVSASR